LRRRPTGTPRTRGQGLVEFALVLPVLMIVLLITLDFARLFMSYITLTNVTRVAANYGSTAPGMFGGPGPYTAYNALVAHESAGLNCQLQKDAANNNPPIPTFPSGSGLSGTSRAEMSCKFSLLTPLINNFFGGAITMAAKSEFPIRVGAIDNIGGSTTLPPPGSPVAAFSFVNVSGGTVDGAGNVTGTGSITVNFQNSSANDQTWDWDFGDLSTHDFTNAPPAHTYSATGTYTVRLTVTNPVGSSTTTHTVTVGSVVVPPPVAGFYGDPVPNPPAQSTGGGSGGAPITGSLDLPVNFTNLSTGASAYSWDFGDGTAPSTAVSPQHTYTTLGVFTVTLTITTPTGSPPVTRASYVTTGCVVPNFANTSTANAQATWTAAGFSGTITYQSTSSPGGSGKSTTPPIPPKQIFSQSTSGGSFIAATQQGKNGPWQCNGDILLRYTP
jgi:PKD repeat protein